MRADVFWVSEDLLQRRLPRAIEPFDHGYLVLPVRRNNLGDGHVFVMRLSHGEGRDRVPGTDELRIYPFEQWLSWGPNVDSQRSILLAHNLFPVNAHALTVWRGQTILKQGEVEELQRSIGGLIWNSDIAHTELKRGAVDELVPESVKKAEPGTIMSVDGALGVVVSNTVLNRRHRFGLITLVPLMTACPPGEMERVEEHGLFAVPEFLKICQPLVEPLQKVEVHETNGVSKENLGKLILQVQSLLTWEETTRPVPRPTSFHLSEHVCLFSNNPRPWRTDKPESTTVDRPPTFAGSETPFPPMLLDAIRYDGPQGALRIELWDRLTEISVEIVLIDDQLPVIDLFSILSDTLPINIIRGPLARPSSRIIYQSIGTPDALEGGAIEVSIHAPGIAAKHTFQLVMNRRPLQ